MAGKRTKEGKDTCYHDTWRLLKKYRDVVWSMELSVQQVKKEFEIEFGSTIDDFLESAYLAGADLGGTKIENHARCIERSNLLSLTQNEPIAVPIFLASFYGLRRSEMLGLRWSAIDFQNGWIHIDTTVVKQREGDHILTVIRDNTTKTTSSKRSLPLCPQTYQYFWNLLQKQRAQWNLCGSSYDTRYTDFVCVNEITLQWNPFSAV